MTALQGPDRDVTDSGSPSPKWQVDLASQSVIPFSLCPRLLLWGSGPAAVTFPLAGPLPGSTLSGWLRKVKYLVQGHTATEGMNSGLSTPMFGAFAAKAILSLPSSFLFSANVFAAERSSLLRAALTKALSLGGPRPPPWSHMPQG